MEKMKDSKDFKLMLAQKQGGALPANIFQADNIALITQIIQAMTMMQR
jgi:hypothetical protein